MINQRHVAALISSLSLAGLVACGGGGEAEITEAEVEKARKEATTEIQQAFQEAPPDVRQRAENAAQAVQQRDYEAALEAQQELLNQPNLTFEQGVAVKQTERAIKLDLLRRASQGDPQAKQAVERMKRTLP